MEPALVVEHLTDALGMHLVAVIAGVQDTQEVHAWLAGQAVPDHEALHRLEAAAEVVALLEPLDSPAVSQAWFQGMNPELDDRSLRWCSVAAVAR